MPKYLACTLLLMHIIHAFKGIIPLHSRGFTKRPVIMFPDEPMFPDEQPLWNDNKSSPEDDLLKYNPNNNTMQVGIKYIFKKDDPNNNTMQVGIKYIFKKDDPNYKAFMERIFKEPVTPQPSSEHFNLVDTHNISFKDIGGYHSVKEELMQIADILVNYSKYSPYNVRTPKGLILEGPPGNGKTLIAKAFSGEINTSFIQVSGSEFQEKYVGVGPARIRELFELAEQNTPCIIFIDEIDAVGRARSTDQDVSASERDNTLNQLLVKLDGFKKTNGVFIIAATNRMDLLDPALLRPGRVDKKIHIGNPDADTRKEIIDIHLVGKSIADNIDNDKLIEMTSGNSGAEIENIINEAMLTALRDNRKSIAMSDIESVYTRTIAGYQITKNIFSKQILDQIAIHELGHAITGFLLPKHSNPAKVHLNEWSPKSPGYTIFNIKEIDTNIYTREQLFSQLVVLLAGRAAEEVFYNTSVTTGATKDISQSYKLAETMVLHYGLGSKQFFPRTSDKYKSYVDDEIYSLNTLAYDKAKYILTESKELVRELAEKLVKDGVLTGDSIELKIYRKYRHLLDISL